jgi:DNA adenine methylase
LEPFLGSGSLYFYINPKKAILGDINFDLIETYEQIKKNLKSVYSILLKMPEGKNEYYKIRSKDKRKLTQEERAARFIYLNRYSFNGLYRTNQNGEFNVPYGGEKTGQLPSRELLELCSGALQTAQLISGDFELVLNQAKSGDFIYLDPPYKIAEKRVFTEYDKSSFREFDIKRLRNWLDKLTEMGIVFLLSYADCEEAEFLKDGYDADEIMVRRNIAGFSKHRRSAGELLVTNVEIVNRKVE